MAKKLPRAIRPTTKHAPGTHRAAMADVAAEPEAMRRATAAVRNEPPPQPVASKAEERRSEAVKLIRRYSLFGGVASMVPAPVIDLAAITAVQIQMLRKLSEIYDVPFSENRGKAIVASLVGSMIPGSSGIGAASLLKGMPFLGTLAASVAMPALATGATYTIGMTFLQHFKSGGTLLDFEPPNYHPFIKEAAARTR